MHNQDVDIIIVGGAMAGAALALGLARQAPASTRIAVVEASSAGAGSHPGFDARAIALSLGSQRILEKHGLWQPIAAAAEPIRHIHVSDRGHFGHTTLAAADYHLPALGQVVELHEIGRQWLQALRQHPQIRLVCPARVIRVESGEQRISVVLDNGETLNGSLLVGADGRQSVVRQHLGGEVEEHDFGQLALIANVETEQAHQGRAFERFTEQGPLALLPMTDHRCSLVWSMQPAQAKALGQLDEAAFVGALQQAFGYRLGRVIRCGRRDSYPLIQTLARRQIGRRCVILGNAAHALHPIAGQGFNLGLRDVRTLIDTLARPLARQQDPGQAALLQQYYQARRGDQRRTVGLTSTLAQLFSNALPALVAGRNLGLTVMQTLPGLKRPLVRQTLGLWSS